MRPVSPQNPSHVVARIPDTEEVGQLPCTYTLCGRVKVNPIDGALTAGTIYTSVSAISFGASGSYLACAILGGAAFTCVTVHGIYRKFLNIPALIDRFNRVQTSFQTAIAGLENRESQLQSALTQSSQLNETLQSTVSTIQNERQKLSDELTQTKSALEFFCQINGDLKLLNEKLDSRVTDLTRTNTSIKDRIHEFSAQNKDFKQGLEKIEEILPHLQITDKSLDHSIDRLDQEFDQDLADLAREMASTRSFMEKIIAAFQQDNKQLQIELAKLKQSGEMLQSDLNRIDENQLQYAALLADYQKISTELRQIKAQIDPSLSGLDSKIHTLADILDRVQEERKDFEKTLKQESAITVADQTNPIN